MCILTTFHIHSTSYEGGREDEFIHMYIYSRSSTLLYLSILEKTKEDERAKKR